MALYLKSQNRMIENVLSLLRTWLQSPKKKKKKKAERFFEKTINTLYFWLEAKREVFQSTDLSKYR
jgi:hypothetical protein